MAEKRMFSNAIIKSDAFLDMPISAKVLYFYLSMDADDEGFVNNAKAIMRSVQCTLDDMNILIAKKFIISFPDGIVVIKHWRIHNYIISDRYKKTKYVEYRNALELDENKAYTQKTEEVYADYIQDVCKLHTQYSIDKISIDKSSIDILSENPTVCKNEVDEIISYLNEKAGTSYRTSTEKTRKCINTRLKEKFTVDDFKTVIDKKCAEWLHTEMEKYLRPETLFGTKFESYLNAKVNQSMNFTDIAEMIERGEL